MIEEGVMLMSLTLIDFFYILMVSTIFTFLIVIEIQLHTMKSLMEKYIDVRLNPDRDKISNISCKTTGKPLTKK
jgi:hypothetical protein